MSTVNAVEEKGPRWREVQRGPKSEELGAQSRSGAKLNPWRKLAPAPARQTRWHVSGVATMTGKQLWTKKARFRRKKNLIQLKCPDWRKRDDVRAVHRRIGGISYALSIEVTRRA